MPWVWWTPAPELDTTEYKEDDEERVFSLWFGNMYIVDFEREKEIGLGPSFPYQELPAGECLVTDDFLENQELISYNYTRKGMLAGSL